MKIRVQCHEMDIFEAVECLKYSLENFGFRFRSRSVAYPLHNSNDRRVYLEFDLPSDDADLSQLDDRGVA